MVQEVEAGRAEESGFSLNAFRIFRARPVLCGTTERPMVLQSQRDCVLQPSPGLPSPRGYPGLASVRFSTPPGLCPISAIGPQPLGLADTTGFSQGSSRLATLGFGAESLWDSALEYPKGIGFSLGVAVADDDAAGLDCGAAEHGHPRLSGVVATATGPEPARRPTNQRLLGI